MAASSIARKPPLALHREIARIRSGLNFRAVESLQKSLAVPMEKLAAVLGMSRATLHRRKTQGKLAGAESERVVRYQRLLARAVDLFGGEAAARRWLTAPQRALGGAVPFEFAATELGAREVESLLGRLEHGVYS